MSIGHSRLCRRYPHAHHACYTPGLAGEVQGGASALLPALTMNCFLTPWMPTLFREIHLLGASAVAKQGRGHGKAGGLRAIAA